MRSRYAQNATLAPILPFAHVKSSQCHISTSKQSPTSTLVFPTRSESSKHGVIGSGGKNVQPFLSTSKIIIILTNSQMRTLMMTTLCLNYITSSRATCTYLTLILLELKIVVSALSTASDCQRVIWRQTKWTAPPTRFSTTVSNSLCNVLAIK